MHPQQPSDDRLPQPYQSPQQPQQYHQAEPYQAYPPLPAQQVQPYPAQAYYPPQQPAAYPQTYQPQPMVAHTGISGTMHAVHAVMTLCSVGLWAPVWIIHTILSQRKTTIRPH